MPKLHVPYLKWRDGRPRFEPGPSLRAKGFRGIDLKDARGGWLRTRGQCADAIERIVGAAAPADRGVAVRASLPSSEARTLSALCSRFRATRHFTAELGAATRRDYLWHMRLLEEWAGDIPATAITRGAIKDLHAALRANKGLATANAVLRSLKTILGFGVDDIEWLDKNRAARMKTQSPPGRLVLWTGEEVNAMIAAADWCGLPAIGDGITLALTTGQIQSGIIALPELVLTNGVFAGKRRKTGVPFFVPPFALLTDRIAIMRARKAHAWPNVAFQHELVGNDGKPYDESRFRKEFRLVRAIASGAFFAVEDAMRGLGGLPPRLRNLPFTPQATLVGKNFADLRDTCITWLMQELKGDINAVCNIVGLSLVTAQAIINKHYLVRSAGVSAALTAQLDAAFHRKLGG